MGVEVRRQAGEGADVGARGGAVRQIPDRDVLEDLVPQLLRIVDKTDDRHERDPGPVRADRGQLEPGLIREHVADEYLRIRWMRVVRVTLRRIRHVEVRYGADLLS